MRGAAPGRLPGNDELQILVPLRVQECQCVDQTRQVLARLRGAHRQQIRAPKAESLAYRTETPRSRSGRVFPGDRLARSGYDLAKDKTTDGQRWLM